MPDAENLSLAPMAGSGIGKKLADLLLSRDGFIELMADTLEESLSAMAPRRWDKASESWVSDPDYRTRLQAVTLLLAHMEGEPVKRIVHQHVGDGGKLDIIAAVRESPELAAQLARMLENAQWKGGRKPKKVQAAPEIEVEGDGGPAGKF